MSAADTSKIIGRIISTDACFEDDQLRIEVWRTDCIERELIGEFDVGDDGRFSFPLPAGRMKGASEELELHLCIYRNEELLVEYGPVSWSPDVCEDELLIELADQEDEGDKALFWVSGQILREDDTPLRGVRVEAFERTLRGEVELANFGATTEEGRYVITASVEADDGNPTVNLILRVLGEDGEELGATPVLFNTPSGESVDVVIPSAKEKPESEYRKLDRRLAGVLDGVCASELTVEEVDFVATQTGVDRGQIADYAAAHRLAASSDVDAEPLYGVLRTQKPPNVASLLVTEPGTVRRAVERAKFSSRLSGRSTGHRRVLGASQGGFGQRFGGAGPIRHAPW